ncbi:hypothetical protein M413DRAFT_28152 [Hebeloma cylindrosporum]|uniref:Uncharacterized protein n=1 Tax=Hebeloma cylindrosporum TaxID=76867 RepID=A0A0C3CBT2_HEBCY|nr:hypothetical protein M413DRAFT_28152 [Hebeloma cylindrosporum h7]
MSSRNSAPRMSTGGKPPRRPATHVSDQEMKETPTRPRRAVKPTPKVLASAEDADEELLGDWSVSENNGDDSDVQFVEQPPSTPATPARKFKPAVKIKEERRADDERPRTPRKKPTTSKKIKSSEHVHDTEDDPLGVSAPLDKDDSMYSGASPSKIHVFEPGALSNNTRAREPESPPDASPKKKQRMLSSKQENTPMKRKSKEVSDDGAEDVTLSGDEHFSSELANKESLDALDGLSFDDLFNASKAEDETVYLEDLVPKTEKPTIVLPEVCEVTEDGLQDKFLLEKGFYMDLPNLPGGRLNKPELYMLPMYPSPSTGRPNFTGWSKMCPKMKIAPLTFKQSGRFVNPSRVHPAILRIDAIIPNERYELTVNGDTAICVSCAMSKESFLASIDTEGQIKLRNKYHLLRAKLLAYEFERASVLFTLLLGKGQLYAIIKGDSNEFQTKSESSDKHESSSSNQKKKDPLTEDEEYSIPGFMNTQSTSPLKSTFKPSVSSTEKGPIKVRALPFEISVPIYDGRETRFDYDDLSKINGNLDSIFKRFPEQEVPVGSFVVIGYISQFSSYKPNIKTDSGDYKPGSEIRWKFTPFIQWVIVVGVSKKNIRGYVE